MYFRAKNTSELYQPNYRALFLKRFLLTSSFTCGINYFRVCSNNVQCFHTPLGQLMYCRECLRAMEFKSASIVSITVSVCKYQTTNYSSILIPTTKPHSYTAIKYVNTRQIICSCKHSNCNHCGPRIGMYMYMERDAYGLKRKSHLLH